MKIKVFFYNRESPKTAPSGFGECIMEIDEEFAKSLRGKRDNPFEPERGEKYWEAIFGLAFRIAKNFNIKPWDINERYLSMMPGGYYKDPITIIDIKKHA